MWFKVEVLSPTSDGKELTNKHFLIDVSRHFVEMANNVVYSIELACSYALKRNLFEYYYPLPYNEAELFKTVFVTPVHSKEVIGSTLDKYKLTIHVTPSMLLYAKKEDIKLTPLE